MPGAHGTRKKTRMGERCPDCGFKTGRVPNYGSGCNCAYECYGDSICEERAETLALRAKLTKLEAVVDSADALAAKVMALRSDQNSWPKEEEVYEAMVSYRALRADDAAKAELEEVEK